MRQALKTVIVTVLFAMMLTVGFVPAGLNSPSAHAAYDPNDPTQRIDLSLTTLAHAKDPNVPEKWEYWSGEGINLVPGIDVSGTNVNIPNATVTLKVPKSQYLNKPSFTDSANASASVKREDDDFWYMDYKYNLLKGGTLSQTPFTLSFKNGVTPNGQTEPITWTIFDGEGQVVKTVEQSIIAKAGMNYTSHKVAAGNAQGASGGYWRRLPGQTKDTWVSTYVRNDDRQINHTGELLDGQPTIAQNYCIGLRYTAPTGAPNGTGEYYGKTVTFTDTLPANATLHPDAVAAGWTMIPGTNKATITMPFSRLKAPGNYCNWTRWTEIKLNFVDAPISEGNAPKNHLNEVSAILDKDTVNYDAGSATANTAFEINRFQKGRTLRFNKWHEHGGWYVIHEGKLYKDRELIDLETNERTGTMFGYGINIDQENNGSSPTGPRSGGLTDFVTEIVDKDLDPRLYYRRVFLGRPFRKNNTALTQEEIDQRVANGQPHLYGVKADGSEVKLTTEPLKFGDRTTNNLYLNDRARQYTKLILRFDTPVEFDNMGIHLMIDVAPLQSDLNAWEAGAYADSRNEQVYVNDAQLKTYHGTQTAADARILDESDHDNKLWVRKVDATLDANIGSNNHVFYENCENKLIAAGKDPKDINAQNCNRVREYFVDTWATGSWGPYQGPAKNLRQVVLLPPGVNYVSTSISTSNWYVNRQKNFEPKVVPNFNNTGKTALIFEYGDVARDENGRFHARSHFYLDTSLYAEPGDNPIVSYTVWDNMDQIRPQYPETDEVDANKNGDKTDKVLRDRAVTNFTPPQELVVRKNVSLDGNSWFLTAPAQDLGGDLYYRLEARNAGFRPVGKLSLLDVYPHTSDRRVAPNEKNEYPVRDWQWVNEAGETVTKEHSSYVTPLTGPVVKVTAINNGVESDATERFDYFYSTVAQGDSINAVRDGEWLTADQVTDWSTIRNFKPVLKAGQTIAPSEAIRFVTKHKIPFDEATKALPVGYRAVNSVAGSLDLVNYAEANEVISEIIKYTVDGIFFRDLNNDGNRRADEPVVAGRAVQLVEADTGKPATDPAGNTITAVTDKNGYYKFDVYKRGNYRVQFTKDASEVYTVRTSDTAPSNHVELCRDVASTNDDTATLDGATAEKCDSATAGDNHLGYTSTFVLDPENRHAIRNAAVIAVKRDLVIRKVDQDGNLLNGIGFKLTWVEAIPGGPVPNPVPEAMNATTGQRSHLEPEVDATAEGFATFKDLPFGKYQLEEVTVPTGVEGLQQPLEIILNGDPLSTDTDGNVLPYKEISNNVVKATVTVKKVDADDENINLAGAVFELVSKTDATRKYISNETGADGIATFTNVLYGDYTLSEKTAPENFNLATETRDVAVRKHAETIEVGNFTNTYIKGSVKLKKVDADTNLPIPGVVFELYPVVDGNKAANPVGEQTTDQQGMLTFSNIRKGSYKLVEKTPATGYLPLGRELDVTIETNGQVVDEHVTTPVTNTIKKANVTLTKVDAEDNTKKLSGVTFKLFAKTNGVVASEATATTQTNGDGVATFENVRYGTYVVRETETLTGYVLASDDHEVTVAENNVPVELGNITNTFIRGSVTVMKTDDDTPAKPLPGVVFGLYKKNNGVVDADPAYEATTGDNGQAQFNTVAYGIYELREKATVAGHNLNETDKREVNIDTSGETNDLTGQPFVNTRIRGNVTVTKHDAKGQSLSDVVFSLYAKDAQGTVAEQAAYTATTGADGVATFAGVLYGKYVLKETTPKVGFNPSTETAGREINVAEQGVTVSAGNPFVNKVITGTVTVTKADKDTPTMLLGGVEFGLYKQTDGVVENTPAYRATTAAENGVATFADVEYGDYQLREITPLINYVGSTQTWEVAVRTEAQEINVGTVLNVLKKGTVTLLKVDADNPETPVAGATFVLKQGDAVKYTATSDNAGNVVFNDVVYGEYVAAETATPENYNLNTQWTANVNVTEDKQLINLGKVTNALKKADVRVTKHSTDDDTPLAGAEFTLKQGDKVVATATSDNTGVALFPQVIYGDYTLVETKAPVGYVLDAQPIAVQVREHGVEVNAGQVENRAIRGSVTLTKIEAKTQQPLEGVEFELVGADDTVVATQATDAEGKLTFSNVRFGQYTVREKAPLEGYVAHGKTYPVNIETDQQVIDLETITNRKIISDITITKVDADTEKPLAGVTFGLYPAPADFPGATPGEAVKLEEYPEGFELGAEPTHQGETDENGKITFTGVEYGKWIVVELKPATGYNPSPETYGRLLTVTTDGEQIDVTEPFKNTRIRGDITLTKVDASGNALAGAKFALRNSAGDLVAEAKSDATGKVTFTAVEYGNYTVNEVAAPQGYVKDNAVHKVEITSEGEVIDLGKVVNVKQPLPQTGVNTQLVGATLLTLLLGIALVAVRNRRKH